jgi:hypothetical protein
MLRFLLIIILFYCCIPAFAQKRDTTYIIKKTAATSAVPAQTTTTSAPKRKGDTMYIIKKKQVFIDTLTPEEKLFMSQTDSGKNVTEEKGSAVFFGSGGKIKGTDMYFAFHNMAPKGTVIKVHNPGTDSTIYVKVIGLIPGTKQYHNTVIGIGAGAKERLGALEEKIFCELWYGVD